MRIGGGRVAMLVVSSDADCGRLSGAKPTPLGACEAEKKYGAEGCGYPVVLPGARTSDSLIDDFPSGRNLPCASRPRPRHHCPDRAQAGPWRPDQGIPSAAEWVRPHPRGRSLTLEPHRRSRSSPLPHRPHTDRTHTLIGGARRRTKVGEPGDGAFDDHW